MFGRSILKWLAALGVGALSAALAYVSGHIGNGPGEISPAVAGVVVFLLTKAVNWATSKVPAKPDSSEPVSARSVKRPTSSGV